MLIAEWARWLGRIESRAEGGAPGGSRGSGRETPVQLVTIASLASEAAGRAPVGVRVVTSNSAPLLRLAGMDYVADRLIDELVRKYLDPPLRTNLFRRKARTWNRSRLSFVDVVDVQVSRWSDHASPSFTLNLGVFASSVYETCWQRAAPDFIKEVDCLVRVRLGALVGDASKSKLRDQWWKIHDPSGFGSLGSEVAQLLVSRALPFFDQLDSLSALHNFLSQDTGTATTGPLGRIYLSIVKAELGDLNGSRQVLEELRARAPQAWMARISAVADRLGIRLEE